VGQAQILTELGKPFELEGLFGAADSRAFENVDKGHDMEQAARAVGQPDPPEAMEEDR
jgi:nuclear GTP-binding protein